MEKRSMQKRRPGFDCGATPTPPAPCPPARRSRPPPAPATLHIMSWFVLLPVQSVLIITSKPDRLSDADITHPLQPPCLLTSLY